MSVKSHPVVRSKSATKPNHANKKLPTKSVVKTKTTPSSKKSPSPPTLRK